MASPDPNIISLEEEVNDVPDRDTCQKRVEEFVTITSTNEALAQFFLQDHNWNVEPSLNAYYESVSGAEENNVPNDVDLLVTFQSTHGLPTLATLKPPEKFTFVTWNLDGLDEHNLKKRTKAVAKIIVMEKPDIVFLQEVVPVTYSYLEEHLPQYMFIAGGAESYFVATLLFRATVYFDGHMLHSFPNSRMGRNLLAVDCHIGSLKLRLLNTHLESTQEFSHERKVQLANSLEQLKAASKDHTSIFAGDLNLRDKEANEVQIPRDVFDLWESCGQRQECKYTWDTLRNTNKSFPGRFKPRLRFDRVYLRQSDPPSINPNHFGLVGIQKVAGTQSFPSDHWGIIVHFDILNQSAKTSSPPPSHNSVGNFSHASTSSCVRNNDTSIECLDVSEDATGEEESNSLKRNHSLVELD